MYKKVERINDNRIVDCIERLRNGPNQEFILHNNYDAPEAIIIAPERHLFAELIDGEWWWVNGCEECNGRKRDDWKTYILCNEHDVCSICGTHRSQLQEAPWSVKEGWVCKPCNDKAVEKQVREFDGYTSNTDEITCPWCGEEWTDSWECDDESEEEKCDNCGRSYSFIREIEVTYSTEKVNDVN